MAKTATTCADCNRAVWSDDLTPEGKCYYCDPAAFDKPAKAPKTPKATTPPATTPEPDQTDGAGASTASEVKDAQDGKTDPSAPPDAAK